MDDGQPLFRNPDVTQHLAQGVADTDAAGGVQKRSSKLVTNHTTTKKHLFEAAHRHKIRQLQPVGHTAHAGARGIAELRVDQFHTVFRCKLPDGCFDRARKPAVIQRLEHTGYIKHGYRLPVGRYRLRLSQPGGERPKRRKVRDRLDDVHFGLGGHAVQAVLNKNAGRRARGRRQQRAYARDLQCSRSSCGNSRSHTPSLVVDARNLRPAFPRPQS